MAVTRFREISRQSSRGCRRSFGGTPGRDELLLIRILFLANPSGISSDEQELAPTESRMSRSSSLPSRSAGEQTQVTLPMPEHESYPHDHKGSNTVTEEKRERHRGAGETAAC